MAYFLNLLKRLKPGISLLEFNLYFVQVKMPFSTFDEVKSVAHTMLETRLCTEDFNNNHIFTTYRV